MNHDINSTFFLAGAIGAVAPEILRLYQLRLRRNRVKFSSFYYTISLAYVLLGGYVAAIFPGITEPFWAMCIGVGTVPTVNSMMKLAGLLSLKLRLAAGKGMEDINRRGGYADVVGMFPGDLGSTRETIRSGTIWDYVNSL